NVANDCRYLRYQSNVHGAFAPSLTRLLSQSRNVSRTETTGGFLPENALRHRSSVGQVLASAFYSGVASSAPFLAFRDECSRRLEALDRALQTAAHAHSLEPLSGRRTT